MNPLGKLWGLFIKQTRESKFLNMSCEAASEAVRVRKTQRRIARNIYFPVDTIEPVYYVYHYICLH